MGYKLQAARATGGFCFWNCRSMWEPWCCAPHQPNDQAPQHSTKLPASTPAHQRGGVRRVGLRGLEEQRAGQQRLPAGARGAQQRLRPHRVWADDGPLRMHGGPQGLRGQRQRIARRAACRVAGAKKAAMQGCALPAG